MTLRKTRKLAWLTLLFALGFILVACSNEETDEPEQTDEGTTTESQEATNEHTLYAVTIDVAAHENHDHDDDDDDHSDDDHSDDDEHGHEGEGIGDTHHFHFAIDVAGTVSHELHGTSSDHFELKLTPFGYVWSEDVTPIINLPEILEGSQVTHYIDDHGCLVIIVQFPEID